MACDSSNRTVRAVEIREYALIIDPKSQFYGDEKYKITNFSSLNDISDDCVIWLRGKGNVSDSVISQLKNRRNVLIICNEETESYIFERLNKSYEINYIVTDYPRDMYFSILSKFFCSFSKPIIHWEKSVIETKQIGRNVSIGINCYIGPEVEIGNNVTIHNNVVIECPCKIGEYSNIYSGAVMGTNGFGYYRVHNENLQIPHFKGIKIGHHVDIGANTCIDRGCLTDTVIGNYVKIDNLVHIAHNVQIEDYCMVVAQAMIGGSSTIGENTYIAPGVRIIDQIKIGQNALIGMGAVVRNTIEDNKVAVGIPARIIREQ